MLKRFLIYLLLIGEIFFLTGCGALLVGAGAVGGTILWQGGKIISEENASMKQASQAVQAAFKAKDIMLKERVTRDKLIQFRGEGPNNERVAVDIFKVSKNSVRIEIRVGLGDEDKARDLLTQIKNRL